MTTRNPQTLADVQAGDSIWVYPSGSIGIDTLPLKVVVERTTKTRIIVNGDGYNRDNGSKIGDKYRPFYRQSSIEIGNKAELRAAATIEKITRKNAVVLFENHNPIFSQKGVLLTRLRCEEAEKELRRIGQWVDSKQDESP
jgi:hypothetical protein